MAIPSLPDAERLLASFKLPHGIVVHARGVSRVAAEAARLLATAGVAVDPQLVEVAALLHDIDKLETRDDGAQHGVVGARWLVERGYAELAEPVASHPINCLLDEARAPRGWPSVIVAVADRHVAQRFVSIDERIDDMAQRYPRYRASLELARAPAHAMEAQLAAAAGMATDQLVRRLRAAWEAGDREAGAA
jgi:putative nucleotidyltransferase with HDIG domain